MLRDVAVTLNMLNYSFETHSKDNILSISCEIAHRWMCKVSLMIINIGSGNGLVLSSNKPLPDPMLAQLYVPIWHHQATVSYPNLTQI